MLSFRQLTIIFIIIIIGLNFVSLITSCFHCGWFGCQFYVWNILVFAAYSGISFALAFLPCSNFHHSVLCKGQTTEKVLSLTFDDGPDPKNSPLVLETLRKHHITATFFCIGKNLEGNEELIRQIVAEGHLIGNHGFSHSIRFDFFSSGRIRSELLKTNEIIKNITGKTPNFFRPPFGVVNPMVSRALKGMSWQTVCWNIRSLDTVMKNPKKISDRIFTRLKPGSIILLHDHSDFSSRYLDNLLSEITLSGYKVVPLDQLLNKPS
ncbi:MAG: polysaccharide deacetylase family protein [Bacteroidetes bacterium]|nr:polysaccharide deacetylase family protein [Bacteroidota bacterium]